MPDAYQSPLMAMAGPADPFFSSQSPHMVGGFQIPGVSREISMLAQMFLRPILDNMTTPGMFAPGLPLSQQNLFTQAQMRRDYMQMQELRAAAMRMDQDRWVETARGNARISGTQFNLQAANQGAQDFAHAIGMPLAMMNPGLYSTINGGRDAVTFASQMWMGSRFAYDPNTNLPRMSPATFQATMDSTYGHFFGPNADPRAARGMSSYQVGGIYNQMMNAGLGPRMTGPNSVQNFMTGMNQSFSILNDILIDQGHANPTPEEMFGIMNSMSQGSMHRMGASGLHNMMQTMMGIHLVTEQPIENIQRAVVAARRQTDALGLQGDAASRAGMQAVMATDAYRRVFGENSAMSQSEMLHVQTSRLASAEASAASMQMAASLQLADTFGEGSADMRAHTAAIRAGQTHFESSTGRRSVLFSDEAEWSNFVSRGYGISASTAQAQRNDIGTLQRIAGQNNLGTITYQLQREQSVQPQVRDTFLGGLAQAGRGVFTDAQLQQMAQSGSEGFFGANGIDPSQASNPRALAAYVRSRYERQFGPMSPDQIRALNEGVSNGVSQVGASQINGLTAQELSQVYSSRSQDTYNAFRRLGAFRGQLHDAMSGANRSTLAGRLLGIVSNATADTNLGDAAAHLLNLVPDQEVRAQLSGVMANMQRLRNEIAAVEAQGGDPTQLQGMLQQVEREARSLTTLAPTNIDDLATAATHRRRRERRADIQAEFAAEYPGLELPDHMIDEMGLDDEDNEDAAGSQTVATGGTASGGGTLTINGTLTLNGTPGTVAGTAVTSAGVGTA